MPKDSQTELLHVWAPPAGRRRASAAQLGGVGQQRGDEPDLEAV